MKLASDTGRLLSEAQSGLPLTERPYQELGARVGLSEEQVIESLGEHLRSGLIREISGIFDASALGFRSTLAAMEVPDEHLDSAAAVVGAHAGVSHNYSRAHTFSLWFTMTVSAESDLQAEVESLAGKAGGWHFRSFPALRVFKIGVRFDLEAGSASSAGLYVKPQPVPVTDDVRAAVRALQRPAPLEARPFARMSEQAGMSEGELLDAARRLAECGALRRWAAVVRHHKAGFGSNVMSAWQAADDEVDALADALAALPSVSHCYERLTYPDWPYRLFAMLHARDAQTCEQAVEKAASETGVRSYVLLPSVREYKKERVRLFG